MTITEIQARLRAKFADDYQLVREVLVDWSNDELLERLAEAEQRLKDSLKYTQEWDNRWFRAPEEDGNPEANWGKHCFLGNEWLDCEERDGWTIFIDRTTFCRAFRDELSDRLSRELIHDITDYDS